MENFHLSKQIQSICMPAKTSANENNFCIYGTLSIISFSCDKGKYRLVSVLQRFHYPHFIIINAFPFRKRPILCNFKPLFEKKDKFQIFGIVPMEP